ncbi:imidazole glycerol phosphate synthase subunit HisH [Wenxinia saemankumensis]|uniref:Imidazole glycerol phosphate synthase subunit HisH n=1 Tax=Wenxinia saemankumensis TaxID=1447782 RepID=A0A1M6GRY5_9RHOB|nr:imidazole glycerol phosphate synthase subunit HisH [Wenxinia saemankumensis]SHJ12659.1 imidazole glycerol phosphate synthase subunit hisH [Wenxinia saemankumensis]
MTTALIDIGSGNLHSAQKAFERMAAEGGGGEIVVTDDPGVVARAERVVLPGDGAFPACRRALAGIAGLEDALRETVEVRGRPFLGICVGMQMMASRGLEYEETEGLGWIDGTVIGIEPGEERKVPHMGWNDLAVIKAHPVLEGIATGDHAYFVHSWHMDVAEGPDLLATVQYGGPVTAIVGRDTMIGTQFHPEKSQETGLRLIANFLAWRP